MFLHDAFEIKINSAKRGDKWPKNDYSNASVSLQKVYLMDECQKILL